MLQSESTLQITQASPDSLRPVRSLVATAQDWPRVRLPFPSSPTFGTTVPRGPLHSLPAFRPPPQFDSVAASEAFADSLDSGDDPTFADPSLADAMGAERLLMNVGIEATQKLFLGPTANDVRAFAEQDAHARSFSEASDMAGVGFHAPQALAQVAVPVAAHIEPLDELEQAMLTRKRRGLLFVAIACSLAVAFVLGLVLSR